MKILYISDSYLSSSVFMSQVHTICNEHSENNEVKLLALCSFRDIKREVPNDSRYELLKVLKFPKAFFSTINFLNSLFFFHKEILDWADIIHCRGQVGTAFAINILKKYKIKKTIIADIRGAMVEELRESKSFVSFIFVQQAEILERFVFANANFFFFVSSNMQHYYQKQYPFIQSRVFPTIVNEKYFYKSDKWRQKIRSYLNIGSDQFVYIYVGGVDSWQNLDEIILKFSTLNKQSYYLIVLTNNMEYIKGICQKNNISFENIYLNTVDYKEVGTYLNASDAGIIIRKNNLINYVACPTKINEYLSCGLKVVDTLTGIGNQQDYNCTYRYTSLCEIINQQQSIYETLIVEK